MIYKEGVGKSVILLLVIMAIILSNPNIVKSEGIFSDLDSTRTPKENFDRMVNQSDADKERAIKSLAEKMKKFILIMKDMIMEGINAFLYFAKFVFNRQFFIGLINLLKTAINAIIQVIKDILLIA